MNAGFTQRSVAKQLGCDQSTIWRWEQPTGARPHPKLFHEFAALVGSSTSWLYDGEDPNEHRSDADRQRQHQADE